VLQVRVPQTGGRIMIASDGVWDAFEKMARVSRMSRSWHTEARARLLWQSLPPYCMPMATHGCSQE
jgi:hypothetical protein